MNLPSALSNQNGVKRKVKKKKKGIITANVAGTKYEIGKKSKPAPLKCCEFIPVDHTFQRELLDQKDKMVANELIYMMNRCTVFFFFFTTPPSLSPNMAIAGLHIQNVV